MSLSKNILSITTKAIAKTGVFSLKTLVKSVPLVCNATVKTVKTAAGATAGLTGTAYNLAYLRRNKAEILRLTHELQIKSRQYQERISTLPKDYIAIGADMLKDYTGFFLFRKAVPVEVQKAYELAYPHKAEAMGFAKAVSQLETDEAARGFASAIKGKLFEIKYVDQLNAELLPQGFHAKLSLSPTQTGHDIEIYGPDGQISQLLQNKATDSIDYVKEAIAKYPHIRVVSTSELAEKLEAEQLHEVFATSISNADLEHHVQVAIETGQPDFSQQLFSVPVASLALLAFKSYTNDSLSHFEEGKTLFKNVLCGKVGLGLSCFLLPPPYGLFVGLCSSFAGRYYLDRLGNIKNERDRLRRLMNELNVKFRQLST